MATSRVVGKGMTIEEEADQLLPAPPEADDLDDPGVQDAAYDYAENIIGRFFFDDNWSHMRDPSAVTTWVSRFHPEVDPEAVLAELDAMALGKTRWFS